MNTLENLTVVITRPKHQAQSLAALICQEGGKSMVMPSITIDPVCIKNQLNQINFFNHSPDIVIFTSANAVPPSKPFWEKLKQNTKTLAIGPGTANALKNININVNAMPNEFSSNGLLTLPCLKKIKNKTVFIFCGKDSTPLLEQTLRQRHAYVSLFECYRRTFATPDPKIIAAFSHSKPNISITTSQETLINFHRIIQEQNLHWLLETPLLVTNPKQTHMAHQLGFKHIITTANATHTEIIQTIASMRHKLRLK